MGSLLLGLYGYLFRVNACAQSEVLANATRASPLILFYQMALNLPDPIIWLQNACVERTGSMVGWLEQTGATAMECTRVDLIEK